MCLECGHELGPSKWLAKCPECGTDVCKTIPIIERSRFGSVFVIVLAVLSVAYVVILISIGDHADPQAMEERVAQRLASDQQVIDHDGSTFWFWKPLTSSKYGIIQIVFLTRTGMYVLLSPNSEPVPGLHPTATPGSSLEWRGDEIVYSWTDPGTLEVGRIAFVWGIAAIHMVVLEVIALILSVVLFVMWRCIKRYHHTPCGE